MTDYGQLERDGDRSYVHFTRRLPHPPEKVWRALTEPEHIATWFPTDIEGERALGAKLQFPFREGEGPTMDGEMLAFDPPSLMELSWGDDVLRFELRPDGDATVLEFKVTFEELGKVARDGAGWHACLDALGCDLAGQPAPVDRWREVRDDYIERFGPEASTIGPPKEWEDVHGSA